MDKPQKQTHANRLQFIQLLSITDQYWIDMLGNPRFHDLNYYDLFTQMWLRLNGGGCDTFHKSELYQLMPNVSQRTAIKYIQIAIDHGLLLEQANPKDLRSRCVTMSTDLKQKIERFLDYSISVFQALPPPTPQQEGGKAR
ncbi:MarR family transcriptional regulator [Nitrosovibrio sp. Nv6]|uniref:MarR family transcriptional regulator n=1 Tax=Nitrosovibrio sp. Nv6 TaxID=1855340 RepID=UPI0008BD91B1|nr:MarR family transcriptional regulator [Nitrosovibrio sp. Nv6]SEO54996.1 hypothetical protein SAMN05216316_0468 [Nitrosovibrio sp. Nv6]